MGTYNDFQAGAPTFEWGNGPRDLLIYDDFKNGLDTNTTTGLGRWFFLETNAGAAQSVDIGTGKGVLKLLHSANDNEVISLQRNVGFLTSLLAPNTPIRFGVRFQHNNVDDTDLYLGLSIQDVSIQASEPANHIGFRLQESDANGILEMRGGKGSSFFDETGLVTMVDSTWCRAFFEYYPTVGNLDTGTLRWRIHHNGTQIRGSRTIVDQFPDTALIMPTIQVQSGNNGGTDFLLVDWIYAHAVLADYVEGTG